MSSVLLLKKGDKVAWYDDRKGVTEVRIVKDVVEMKPTCLAEHLIFWEGGIEDRVCNHKALVVLK